ncbi:hypothetical protein D9615_002327 [Tricholomella constricta]|uniref:DUF7330 domain-containing protein n=1 Tax=Tricholomella constricta TaxID=117010 RepID=A0A8H5HM38_9AGAR|nr:hypothetical protein D9615_002327 [Tricholomella constricta]
MIIVTGENTNLMSKSTAGTGLRPSSDPPPSYQATQPSSSYVIQHEIVYRESPTRRFWRAFVVAILVWFLVSLLGQSIYGVARRSNRIWGGNFPVPSNIVLSHCPHGEEWSNVPYPDAVSPDQLPYAASTSFKLPLSYKTLFLLSRGSQAHGTVNIVTSQDVSDVAKVHVTVKYYNKDIRDDGVKVCLIRRANDDIGVGFFTRQWYGPEHMLFFEATVVLPKTGNNNTLLHIESFETDVPNVSHKVGDLRGLVDFSYINLKGSNAPISATSISAETAVFRTSNSPITGVFNVSRSLTLKTSNSPIQVDVGVHNEKSHVSELIMRTSNGKIDSRVSLTSVYEGGRYLVTAISSNGPVSVKFPTSPMDSTLKLQATTSNSPASVSLDPAYEGTLALSTSNFAPSVRQRVVKDPSGKGRKRTVETSTLGRGVLRGSVSWSGQEGPGTVQVRSSNSPVTVAL